MTAAIETIAVTLVHSVGGLMAEITGFPVIVGPQREAQRVKYDLAAEALKAKYPGLLIRRSCVEDDQVLFWCEPL